MKYEDELQGILNQGPFKCTHTKIRIAESPRTPYDEYTCRFMVHGCEFGVAWQVKPPRERTTMAAGIAFVETGDVSDTLPDIAEAIEHKLLTHVQEERRKQQVKAS